MLEALEHNQDPICIKTERKRSKMWDMRWWWIQDKVKLKEFQVAWERGKNNLADY